MVWDLFQLKKPIMLGIDISSSSVKLLELSKLEKGYRVESYAVENVPVEAMQEQEIKDIDAVGMAVERAVKRARTGARYAAAAVAGSAVITKVIQMRSDLNENDLAVQIQLEAERYIPYPLQEVNIDFQVLGPSAKRPDMNDVLLAASRTEMIDTLQEVLSIGGLTAKVIDIEAYAMERAFNLIRDQFPSKGDAQTIAMVNIGATTTSFSVLHDRSTVYTRDYIFGGKQLTEEIQRRYGLTFEEASLAKKQGGLPDDYKKEVLEPFKEAIVQQVSRSLQFFFSSSQFAEVDHIILAGGSAPLTGLAQRVEEKLGVATSLANPFMQMSISPKVSVPAVHANAASLMICCGLALRSFNA